MKKKKRETERIDEYSKRCAALSQKVFEYILKNGGDDIPIPFLMEMFLSIAAKVGKDLYVDADCTKDEITSAAQSIFQYHFDLYIAEKDGLTIPLDTSNIN